VDSLARSGSGAIARSIVTSGVQTLDRSVSILDAIAH